MPTYTTNYGRTPCTVIRQDEWKLIHWFGDYLDPTGLTPDNRPYGKLVLGARTELYNLNDDPGETHDLALARPQKTRNLLRRLEIWRKDVGAKAPVENPAFDLKQWWLGASEGSEATK
jgi:arylsulfatase A-like enzyme